MTDRQRALLVANGAVVFVVGMIAGFPFALVVLGTPVGPGDVRGWRMAHLEGILNGLLLVAIAAAGGHLRLGPRAQGVLFWSLVVTAWGNEIASVIGPLLGGRGLEFGGGVTNSVMYVLFMIAVVTVLVAMAVVLWGALRKASEAT